ncbi:hypothetical protein KHA80_02925 [Anaerobacillus sp. HL2]|nr:hypothetical protein KHA80_02925 [Anaerobacillus sp. HL2]
MTETLCSIAGVVMLFISLVNHVDGKREDAKMKIVLDEKALTKKPRRQP